MALKALYRCNDGSGTTLLDSSGNAANATLVGGATFGAGKYGGGLSFTTGYGTVAMAQPAYPFTVCAWAYLAGTSDRWLVRFSGEANHLIGLRAYWSSVAAHYIIKATAQDPTGGLAAGSGAVAASGAWVHCAAVFHSISNRVGFVDGVAQAANTQSRSPVTTSLLLSSESGMLDEIRIYNTALDATAIAAAMNDSGANSLLARRRRMMQCV